MWIATNFLLTSAIAFFLFQNSTPSPAETAKAVTPSSAKVTVSGQQPVITVHGVCDTKSEKSTARAGACATVITREQFEKLMQGLHPGEELPANRRNSLGKFYAEYIAIEAAARKEGMEDTDEFHEFSNWMRVLSATEYYRLKLQQKYGTPSQEEINAYYQQHLAEYETVRLARVLIPRENTSVPNKDEFEKKARAVADMAQADLVKDMDPAEVQKKAYTALGLPGPPPVDVGKKHRKELIAEEATEVFSLKTGEITRVQTEATSYVIYKILNRDTAPEEDQKKAIAARIVDQKFKQAMKTVLDAAPADLNPQYFGATGSESESPRSQPVIITH